jgi:hypothetical protein
MIQMKNAEEETSKDEHSSKEGEEQSKE